MAFSSILLTLTLHWTQPLGGRVPWLSLRADNGKGLKEHRIPLTWRRTKLERRIVYIIQRGTNLRIYYMLDLKYMCTMK